MPESASSQAPDNRLAREKSPYLLQHRHNPVDWFPWGDEAFARARDGSKPVFLSIGYSTCHWCHVMERESFENAAIARFLNEHFVSIKVDREERPDVDRIYMTFVQSVSGQGGWPLNVFLTPDLKPFYGGTYFPPAPLQGRPSFLQILQQVAQVWNTRRDEVVQSASDLHLRLQEHASRTAVTPPVLNPELLHEAARLFQREYDPAHGGFGGAPKFPRPSQPAFLLRYGVRFKHADSVRMVVHTCERMAAGGLFDQLGGGFARYSVDERWLVPHFEKMLYDNAQLVNLYLDAHLVSGEARLAEVAREVLRYVLRDMTHPEGGFYSAEDADSEGHEGKFYCWTRAELKELLVPDEFALFIRRFGVTEQGNFIDHSNPHPLSGQNVLSLVDPTLSAPERPRLESALAKMNAARSRRIRPHLDDKILSSWNGLMLGAFARAGAILKDPAFLKAAAANLAFLKARLWDAGTGTLYHRWREGERDSVQLLDAYACLLAGVLDLYEATLEPASLEFALQLADSMIARFHDPERGGFWKTEAGAPNLLIRVKEDYDGAEPSGNSVAVLALLRLSAIAGREDLKEAAVGTLRALSDRLHQLPQAVPLLLLGLDYWLEQPRRVVITGTPENPETRALLAAAHSVYQPGKVVLSNTGPVESLARSLPANGESKAYLCTATACQAPTSDPAMLARMLAEAD